MLERRGLAFALSLAPRQTGPVRTYATKGGTTEQREPWKMSKSTNEQGVNLVLIGTVPMKEKK